jgi:hypothetical protein
MNILPGTPFSPTLVVGSISSIRLAAQDGTSLVLMNESPANLYVTFPNNAQFYLGSYDKRKVSFTGQMAQPAGDMLFTVQSIPLVLVLLANNVVGELYNKGEFTPEIYPAVLIRQLRAFS